MLKHLKYYFFLNLHSIILCENEYKNHTNEIYTDETLLIEENLVNNYGTIILKEYTDKYIVYICSRDGLISIVNINKSNLTIHKVISKSFKKKQIQHPKIVLSTGPLSLKKKYLKEKYTSNINITPIIKLVENWQVKIYTNILKLTPKTFMEMLDSIFNLK